MALKIANFQVRLHGANQRPNDRWLSFRPKQHRVNPTINWQQSGVAIPN